MKLTYNELTSLFEVYKKTPNNKNLKIKCPKCGHNECYISINTENHPGRCWRENKCGYTFNIFNILRDQGRLEEFNSEFKSYTETLPTFQSFEEKYEIEENEEYPLPMGFKTIDSNEYLESRGFNKNDFENIKPGITKIYPKYRDCIIFPVVEYGKNVGFVSRSIHTKEKCEELGILRYQKSESKFENIIYGLSKNSNVKTTIVVEGIFDYRNVRVALDEIGEDFFVFPLLGVFLSKNQSVKLKNNGCKNLIFLLDKDIEDKLRDISKQFLYDFNCFVSFCGQKDPGDSSSDEILDSINSSIPLNDFLLNTISKALKND